MHIKKMKQTLLAAVMSMSALLAPVYSQGEQPDDTCSREILFSYFPENLVKNTLQKFNVPQNKWSSITQDLATIDQNKDVLKKVEEKGARLQPNPFKERDPTQRQIAVKIFRETLLEIFSDVLQKNEISDTSQYQAMLDDIQKQKFTMCMQQTQSMGNDEQPKQPPISRQTMQGSSSY